MPKPTISPAHKLALLQLCKVGMISPLKLAEEYGVVLKDSPELLAVRRLAAMGIDWKRIEEIVEEMRKAGVFNV